MQRILLEPDNETLDQDLLRRAMGRFVTGVTVVTTCGPEGKLEGVTANSFSTVSLEPPLVLWSLGRKSASFASFHAASHFAINILGCEQVDISRHFSTRQPDKLAGIAHEPGVGGCPLLANTIAHFECVRDSVIDGGDHSIFIGRVVRASFRDGDPLVFSGGRYQRSVALTDPAVA